MTFHEVVTIFGSSGSCVLLKSRIPKKPKQVLLLFLRDCRESHIFVVKKYFSFSPDTNDISILFSMLIWFDDILSGAHADTSVSKKTFGLLLRTEVIIIGYQSSPAVSWRESFFLWGLTVFRTLSSFSLRR
jgi:hypothetical protein